MPYYYYGFDPTYVLVLIGAVICLIASARVKSTFNKYSRYRSMSGMTGAQAAERILNSAGIYDVTVCHISGSLTDHYNPSKKTLNLSDSVYGSNSVAAIGVAAHECGHAIQHQKNYVPLKTKLRCSWRMGKLGGKSQSMTVRIPMTYTITSPCSRPLTEREANGKASTGSIIPACHSSGRV